MTLAEAVAVLNERRHRDCGKWCIVIEGDCRTIQGEDRYDDLDEFEAIAIAEKYQREATP
jgi:hypothetical protein